MGKGFLYSRAAIRHRFSSVVLAGALLAGTSVGASVIAGTSTAAAATTTVNCATTNLQTAIDNAASGDILVVTGTCQGNFVIGDKTLTLLGSGHAVLDGQHNGPALSLNLVFPVTGLPVATVDNFSIVNGSQSGISSGFLSTLTLNDDVVTGNSNPLSFGVGGGVATAGVLVVNDTAITHNSSSDIGGGIGTPSNQGPAGTSVTVNDSTISDNSAAIGGGVGEALAGPGLTLHNTTVSGNSGGGINVVGDSITLDHSAVIGNTGGGGLVGWGMTLQDSLVIGNTSMGANPALLFPGDGGGINSAGFGSPLELDHSAVIGNAAAGNGGGISLDGNTATLNNSVVAANTAGGNGGGIFLGLLFPGGPSPSATLNSTTVNGNKPNNCYPLGSVGGCTG
jgi:hypothetical protein